MDPGYRPENRRLLLDNAALLGLPVKVFDTRLFEVVDSGPLRHLSVLPVRPHAARLPLQPGAGAGLQ